MSATAMFSAGTALTVAGGTFTNIMGNQNNQSVTIIQAPERPRKDEVKAVLKIVRKHVTIKTWNVHTHVSGTRAPETGREFYASEEMAQWRTTPRGFIWATGSPGAGKTHLASSVFDRLHAQTKADEDAAVVITYLRYNDETTEWDAVMGLLIHLVESKPLPSVLEIIKKGFAEHEQRNSRPTFEQLSQILRAVVRKYKRCYIIIDGLDESRWEIQMMLVNLLATLDANILLMSRVLQLVQDRLQELRSTRAVFVTVAAHEKDLDRYISHIIETNPRLAKLLADPKMQALLRDTVKAKAQGMFLHVSLQMEALRDCLDLRSIFDVVNEFPVGMDALYLRTLERIDRQPLDHGRRARRALAWILYSHRPLLLADIQHAIAAFAPDYEVQQDRIICEGDLAMICCGLIAVDDKTSRVRLVHETAQHYLGKLLKEECPKPHEMMALTCMKVLEQANFPLSSISTPQEMKAAFDNTPLLEYAYWSVGYHIREGLKEQPSLLHRALSFVRSCKFLPYHHPLFKSDDPNAPTIIQHLAPLHVAVLLNLPRVVQELMKDNKMDVNTRATAYDGRRGWSSLMIACVEGREEVIPALFSSPQLDASENSCHKSLTPLMVASSQGHNPVVQALLGHNPRKGAILAHASRLVGARTARRRHLDVNHRHVNVPGETALMMAARGGYAPVVGSLLAVQSIDIGIMCSQGNTAYIIAIKHDQPAVVQLFHTTTTTLDVNARYKQDMTALMHASECGSQGAARIILAVPGVDPNLRNLDGHSALSLASFKGHRSVVELLLATPGVDPNQCDADGDSHLIIASRRGLADVVKGLVAVPGVDVNFCNSNGDSALMEAAHKGHVEVVMLLLAVPGVDPNLCGWKGDTGLMRASQWGHTEIVKLFLAVPALDARVRDNNGNSALMHASSGGHAEIVKLLLAVRGVDINLRDQNGDSALMQASRHGKREVVNILLAVPGVELNVRNQNGDSVLMLASYGGDPETVKLLRAAPGADASTRNKHGDSAFMQASYRGHLEVVKLLLTFPGVDPELPDKDGNTALIQASHRGHVKVVKLLLSLPGVDVNRRNKYGNTALMEASLKGHEGIVELLLAAPGIDRDVCNDKGLSAFKLTQSKTIINLLYNTTLRPR